MRTSEGGEGHPAAYPSQSYRVDTASDDALVARAPGGAVVIA